MFIVDLFGFFTSFTAAANSEAGWLAALSEQAASISRWIEAKYVVAPALVLGLGLAISLPLIATVGFLMRSFILDRKTGGSIPFVEVDPNTQRTRPGSLWRQNAWLELSDSRASTFQIGQGIVRIGRETDNDLCLADPTVHRYHAVLERTPEAEYIISYIGDPGRDGLMINGQPVRRQRLRGGEVLQIGAIKLRFALANA